MKTIYLDNNATTKIAPEVLDEMKPYLSDYYGNPSSMHTFGGKLYSKIEESRAKVAGLIGAEPEEIIFMSCGTESDNTALMSAAESYPQKRHIVTSRVEHPAVFNFVKHLARKGYRRREPLLKTILYLAKKDLFGLGNISFTKLGKKDTNIHMVVVPPRYIRLPGCS